MGRDTLLMVGNNELVLIQHVIKRGLVTDVGMKFLCMIYMFISWLFVYVGKWLIRNPLGSLGETSGSCLSGRDVIPWPLLVGVHGGAPSV